jgi:hypothetical protein
VTPAAALAAAEAARVALMAARIDYRVALEEAIALEGCDDPIAKAMAHKAASVARAALEAAALRVRACNTALATAVFRVSIDTGTPAAVSAATKAAAWADAAFDAAEAAEAATKAAAARADAAWVAAAEAEDAAAEAAEAAADAAGGEE